MKARVSTLLRDSGKKCFSVAAAVVMAVAALGALVLTAFAPTYEDEEGGEP